MKKALIKKADYNKVHALAEYLGVAPSTLKEKYTNHYETEDGEEYLVLDEEQANSVTYDEIESLVEDMGLDAFSESFQQTIIEWYLDEDYFKDMFYSMEENYIYDMEEDELFEEAESYGIDTENKNYNEVAQELFDTLMYNHEIEGFSNEFMRYYGFDELNSKVKETPYMVLLFDEIVEHLIDIDGRGRFIALYDFEEIELDNNLYAYRVD